MVLWMKDLHGSVVEGSGKTHESADLYRSVTCVSIQTCFFGIQCRSTLVDPSRPERLHI